MVTDAHQCTTTATVTITQPAIALSAVATTDSNVRCHGETNVSATVIASNGTPGYSYSWNNGQTNATATGLGAGTYTVTVTDAHGCTYSTTTIITQPFALGAIAIADSNVRCNGETNVSATVIPSNGTPGYAYSWNNGQTNTTATGLGAGTYTVTVTDGHGCTYSTTVTITQPAIALSAIATADSNVRCNGETNVSATVIASNGTA
jgi:uncharacterized protein YqiB (DUF1249 family)